MKYEKIAWIIFLLIFLSSCTSDSIDNEKYRNEHYIWFEEEGKSEGSWVAIDDNSEYLKNGNYTVFYNNGKIFETGHLNELGQYDTAFFYDINGINTHNCTRNYDKFQTHILKDGDFYAYSTNGQVIVSGISQEHKLKDIKWHGDLENFAHIFNIYSESRKVVNESNALFTKYLKYIDQQDTNDTNAIGIMDSSNNSAISQLIMQEILLRLHSVGENDRIFKSAVSQYIKLHKETKTVLFREIIDYCRDGLSVDERKSSIESITLVENSYKAMNLVLESAMVEKLNPYRYQDYLYEFLDSTN